MFHLRSVGCVCALSVLTACTGDIGDAPVDAQAPAVGDSTAPGETAPEGSSLDAIFERAALEFDVPASLLKSIAWVETGFHMVEGHDEMGMEPAYGVMALRGAALERGAELADVSIEDARFDRESNVRAAAALLDADAELADFDRDDVGAWAQTTGRFSGIKSDPARRQYVHEGVYRTLRTGVYTEAVSLEPLEVTPLYPLADSNSTPGPDYADSVWRPSPNHSSRPNSHSGDPQMVVIHTCEGSYSGCWGWLSNSQSGVSAHYVVNNDGSDVSQLVRESRKAWHIGATYKCERNGNTSCELNGAGSNNFTVGIEHAGYASQSAWDQGLLQASAKLTCDISKGHAIPLDPYHVVGHGQLQPYNRVDPGPNWPWAQYLDLANSYCNNNAPPPPPDPNDPPPPPPPGSFDVIVDSNNSRNAVGAACEVSSNWTASSNVSGYYNTGYWWRSTGSSSDLAKFKVELQTARRLTVQAWWPAASDRSANAPFLIHDGNGQHLDTVYVNQRQRGGQWVELGTYNFTPGWNAVSLSRWTTPGYVVVADAVRFREAP